MSGVTGNTIAKKPKLAPVQVYLRIRPKHANDGASAILCCTPKEIHMKGHLKGYSYDQIFDEKTSQVKVYKTVASKMIPDVCKGYNCTIFAYGQTGTGKTYTVIGGDSVTDIDESFNWQVESSAGIILRAAIHLFEELDKLDPNIQRTVTVSFMEIYNEEIRDLLCDKELTSLRIYEDKQKAVHVKNLQEVTVINAWDIIKLLRKGCEKRQVACTLMNSNSSRSHSVFTINVSTMQRISLADNISNITCGKLNLIDLAGSENIARSGSKEQRAREATNINQSLLTLGRVIKALVENSSHVPYRESKLTRILQDSLGGKSKTSIIATISPGMASLDETINTLEYAHNARSITNCPAINLRTSANAAAVQEELNRLKRDLFATANEQGIYMDKENYDEMTQSLTEFRKEIAHKHDTIRALTEQVEDLEAQRLEWENLKESFNKTSQAYQMMKTEIQKKEEEMLRESELLEYYKTQSSKLEEFADLMLTRESHLHKKLAYVSASTSKNKSVIQEMADIVSKSVNENFSPANSGISNLVLFNEKVCHMIDHVTERLKDESRNSDAELDQGETEYNRTILGNLYQSVEYLEDKFKTFIETFDAKIADLQEVIEPNKKRLAEMKGVLEKEKQRSSEVSTLLSNDWRNYQALQTSLIASESQQNSAILSYIEDSEKAIAMEQKRFEKAIAMEQKRLQELKDMVAGSELKTKLAKYTESRKRIFERMSRFQNMESEAFNQLDNIMGHAMEAVSNGHCNMDSMRSCIEYMRTEISKVLEHIVSHSKAQNTEIANVLNQISKILNIEGNTQIQMVNESLCMVGKELVEKLERRVEMADVPISTGDTPKPLEGSNRLPHRRLSIVKDLFKQRDNRNDQND